MEQLKKERKNITVSLVAKQNEVGNWSTSLLFDDDNCKETTEPARNDKRDYETGKFPAEYTGKCAKYLRVQYSGKVVLHWYNPNKMSEEDLKHWWLRKHWTHTEEIGKISASNSIELVDSILQGEDMKIWSIPEKYSLLTRNCFKFIEELAKKLKLTLEKQHYAYHSTLLKCISQYTAKFIQLHDDHLMLTDGVRDEDSG